MLKLAEIIREGLKIKRARKKEQPEVKVPEETRLRAKAAVDKMLEVGYTKITG